MNELMEIQKDARPQFSLAPRDLSEAMQFAEIMSKSSIIPKDFAGNPGNILVAVQWGMELGLQPMQAMQNIAVINGRPSLWGDAVIALVKSSPVCEYVIEEEGEGVSICRVKRRGEPEQVRTFTDEDAKAAGLKGKQGPWTQYPRRMRQMRARSWALRDVFPDVLRGMPIAEEVMDSEPKDITPSPEVQAALAGPKPYPDADFKKNLPAWADLMQAGKKTPDQIIAMVSTKGTLSAEQIAAIHAAAEPAAPSGEMSEAEREEARRREMEEGAAQ